MKTIRNFFLFMFVFVLLVGGASFWFLHSSALSSYESVENGKKAVNSYVENWFTAQKNSSIEWALDKVNYKPQDSTNNVKEASQVSDTKKENISEQKKIENVPEKSIGIGVGNDSVKNESGNGMGATNKATNSPVEVDFSKVNSMDFIVKDGVSQVALLDKDKKVVITLKAPFIKDIKSPTSEELKMLGELISQECGDCSFQMRVKQTKTITARESILGNLFGR